MGEGRRRIISTWAYKSFQEKRMGKAVQQWQWQQL
jgi:hypothetical protein